MRIIPSALFCTGLLLNAQTVASESLSVEETLNRLNMQKERVEALTNNLGATRSLGVSTGGARGLSVVTLGDEAPVTEDDTVAITDAAAQPTETTTLDPNRPLVPVPANAAIRFEDDLAVNVRIEFAFDSAAIAPSQRPALDQMCQVMKMASDINIFRIIGHTDASGSDEYNKRLSELRAAEVGRYLENCGIAGARLNIVGYGEQFLATPDDPDAAGNRRVEFQALG